MSMTLVGVPDHASQLRSLQQELYTRNQQLAAAEKMIGELESELAREKAKSRSVERGAQKLRQQLSPLYQALGMVFGEIETMGIGDSGESSSPSSSDPRKAAVWDSWVEKLGGKDSFAGKMIVALLQHGALTSKQIAIHIGTKRMQTVYETTLKVNKAGILDKNGDRFSLKEL